MFKIFATYEPVRGINGSSVFTQTILFPPDTTLSQPKSSPNYYSIDQTRSKYFLPLELIWPGQPKLFISKFEELAKAIDSSPKYNNISNFQLLLSSNIAEVIAKTEFFFGDAPPNFGWRTLAIMSKAEKQRKTSPDLTSVQKWSIICWSMKYHNDDKMRIFGGGLKIITDRFSVCKSTVKKILADYRDQLANGEIFPDLEPKSKKVCGVKLKLTDEMRQNIIDLHFLTEGSSPVDLFVEQYEAEFGELISRSAMERYLSDLAASTKRVYLAPSLSDKQRCQRLKFILGLIVNHGHGVFRFRKEVRIHVDEKWFFVQELQQKVRYLPCEERPKERIVIHKSHIEKVMFLAAIGRPETFDNVFCLKNRNKTIRARAGYIKLVLLP